MYQNQHKVLAVANELVARARVAATPPTVFWHPAPSAHNAIFSRGDGRTERQDTENTASMTDKRNVPLPVFSSMLTEPSIRLAFRNIT